MAASTDNSFNTDVSVRWRWVSGVGLVCGAVVVINEFGKTWWHCSNAIRAIQRKEPMESGWVRPQVFETSRFNERMSQSEGLIIFGWRGSDARISIWPRSAVIKLRTVVVMLMMSEPPTADQKLDTVKPLTK